MNYITIKKDDLMNGDGIRTVLFVSGCHHHCKHCQNVESWSFDYGQVFDDVAMSEVLDEVSKDYVDGLTISGGDPFAPENRKAVYNICKTVKDAFPTKTIWIYTGYSFDDVKDEPVVQDRLFDVLVDGLFVEDLKDATLHYRGSSNQNIIYLNK